MKSQHCQNFILYGEICQIFDQRRKNDQKVPYITREED